MSKAKRIERVSSGVTVLRRNSFAPVLAGMALAFMAAPAAALADAPKPMIQGTYEVVKVQLPNGKELDASVIFGSAVWGRMLVRFEGSRLTMIAQHLHKDKAGHYGSCNVSITGSIVWSASGYTVPATVEASSTYTDFAKLTRKEAKAKDRTCSISLDANTIRVEPGDNPKLAGADGTLMLKPASDDVDWKRLVK